MKLLKLFNPMAYYRGMRRLHRKLRKTAPYNNYPSYNEYWSDRYASGRHPGILHRYKVIASLLPSESSVLDFGCGDGAFGNYLKQVRPDCRFHGVDISKKAVEFALERGLSAEVIDPALRVDQQVSGQFDCVTAMEVLEHIVDAEEVMASIVNLSRGAIFITIPNVGYFQHRLRLAIYGRFPVTTILFHMKEHVRFWTYKDFEQWISMFNVEIVSCIGQLGLSSSVERYAAKKFPKYFAPQVIYQLRKLDNSKISGI